MGYEIYKQHVRKVLEDEEFQLPKRITKNYKHSITNLLNDYCNRLTFLGNENRKEIKKICDYLIDMSCNDQDYCYQKFVEMLDNTVLLEKLNIIKERLPIDGFGKSNVNLFRVREIEDDIVYEREDIFHLPENLKENQKVYRYNINGKPSLYLNSTIYGCCNELNKKDNDKLIGSLFRLSNEYINKDQLFIIDLGTRPRDFMFNKYKTIMNYSYTNYLYVYPLIAACSFIAPNKEKSAPAVYCITNVLLKWLSQNYGHKLCGIRYFSCTQEEYKIEDAKGLKKETITNQSYTKYHINYVFPTEIGNNSCRFSNKLANAFLVSKPRHMKDCLDIKDFETTIKKKDIKTLKKIKNDFID